jgi:nucleotide-binding universal stress UspA family protein
MFQRILVPLDGSLRAERALPIAARIARHTSGTVHLIQVINPQIDYSGGLAPAPLLSEQVIEMEMTEASRYLQSISTLQLSGIATTTEVSFGFPAQCVLAAAAEQQSDLIVLCSHGRTGFVRWALGSVAHTLSHESTVPTLVLRESDPAVRLVGPDTTQPLRALVPLDGSPLAEAALAPAAHLVSALAAPARGQLHLIQVVLPLQETATKGEDIAHYDEARARASTYLAQIAERLQTSMKELPLSVSWSVASNHDVASTLVNLAEQTDEGEGTRKGDRYDLIAVSTHGRHGFSRWVMGSVTDRMLNTTKLPMMIVRPSTKER